jgi:AcrR family transcriptional regulator
MSSVWPEPETSASEVRARVSAAARDLFAARGYERTTVDAIAERARVGRRTFFRYFRSKDDAIFPDHERIVQAVATALDAFVDIPPVRAICAGARLVFRSYVDEPVVAVQRYRLTQSVPALRDREIASVSQYIRLFSHYLRLRFGDTVGSGLHADVIAAAVVAAHNQVLREWLRDGGDHDPFPTLDSSLSWVTSTFEAALPGAAPEGAPAAQSGEGEDVVVAVFRAGDPIDDVVERILRSL